MSGRFDHIPGIVGKTLNGEQMKHVRQSDMQAPPANDPPADFRFYGDETPKLPPLEILTVGELVQDFPKLRPTVIEGVARQGEVINVVSKSKIGKSWLMYGLAHSIVSGRRWLDQFECKPGKVLLVDNELHKENLAFRISEVAAAMGIRQSDYHTNFHVCSLRGKLRTIFELDELLNENRRGEYAVVILDALYRMFPKGMSENDNAMMAEIYNMEDRYAEATDAVIVNVLHATKGDQSGKDVSDVGAGAGSQSRAADTHLILRPHEEENCVALDAVVRSFSPIEPRVLRWNFPVWSPADDLDPEALKGTKTAKTNEAKDKRLDEKRKRVVEFLGRKEIRHNGATQTAIKNGTGISVGLLAVLNSLVDDENLVTCEIVHPKNKACQAAWKIKPDETAERLKDGFEGRNSVLQSGSSPSAEGRIPLKGEYRPSANDGLPKLLKDGFPPEVDTSNQRPDGKRKTRKPSKPRKASA